MRLFSALPMLFSAWFLAVTPTVVVAATPKKSGTTKKPAVTKEPVVKPPAPKTPAKPSTTGKSKPATAPEKTPEPKTTESEGANAKPTAPDPSKPAEPETKPVRAPSGTLEPSDLVEFDQQSPRVQRLIEASLALTKLNLTYTYGSADPAKGGMDCSGTIYHTLRAQGFTDVPRDSPGQYVWVRKAGGFEAVISTSAESFEFDALRPGDLMFWSGTYSVQREIPITHVMLYLGREKKTKQRVMFGASDGRSYKGIQRWGVSVFDFKMPKTDTSRDRGANFLGYGPIPGLRAETVMAEVSETAPESETKAVADETPKSATKKPSAAKSTTSKSATAKHAPTGSKKKRVSK
jgi:peptidoglycan DL-endopeptidase CwlO